MSDFTSYDYTPRPGELLYVGVEEGGDRVRIAVVNAARNADVLVMSSEVPAVAARMARAMHAAAGLPAPVILERPETGASPWRPNPDSMLAASRMGRNVRIELDRVNGGAVNLPPGMARPLAAVIAALADEAEKEPDPAEVGELADIMRKAALGRDWDSAAREVLRQLRDKQQRGEQP